MRKNVGCSCLLLMYAQIIWAQLATPLDRIGITPKDSFQDLDAIGNDIGDASIIILEDWASADNGASYEAIGRLINFFHQEKGFQVLMWNLGIFEGKLMDEAFGKGDVNSGLRTMYKVWRESSSIQNLARYIKQSHQNDKALSMVGNSCQFHNYGKSQLMGYLDQNKSELGLDALSPMLREELDLWWTTPKRLKELSSEERKKLVNLIQQLDHEIPENTRRLVQNMLWFVELEELRATLPRDKVVEEVEKFRRETKEKNIEWLMEHELRGKKIIVFGGQLPRKYLRHSYRLGITGYSGVLGRPGQSEKALDPPAEEYVESFLHYMDQEFLFISKDQFPENYTHSRLPKSLRSYDGIVFINEVFPNF